MAYPTRRLTPADSDLLWQMLTIAAHESDAAAVQAQPALARYVNGWGRAGDLGLAALAGPVPVGAAWLRLWPPGDHGFGYVAPAVPELAIALQPSYCGQGIGTDLLTQLLALAQPHYPAICLSVRADNPAVRLYQRLGFSQLQDTQVVNRTGGLSWTMVYRCEPSPPLQLRAGRPDDVMALRSLFANTVRQINCRDYSPAQIEAWAAGAQDEAQWRSRLASTQVFVAEQAGEVVGFTNLEPDGHIDLFYVHAQRQGQGIGRRLFGQLEAAARSQGMSRLYTEASITAKPFFLKCGFYLLNQEQVQRRGLWFSRFNLAKPLL